MRLIDTNRPNYKTIGIQQMFSHERRAAINQRAKLMGRMVISSSMADAQNPTINSSRAIPIRVTSRVKLSAMPASLDLRCVFRQPAGTTPQPRCKVGFC
jgi:hypothetical protein